MATAGTPIFLSRPRRFGKSLLLSTFEAYFLGRNDIFKGLFLVEMLKKTDNDLRQLDGIEVPAVALTDYRADYHNPVPIIYQSGYLTIQGYDRVRNFYTLGFPNAEVEYGWLNFIASF